MLHQEAPLQELPPLRSPPQRSLSPPQRSRSPPPRSPMQSAGQHSTADQYHAVELRRGTRGFGFSIRGGAEFGKMPLYVLRIADGGPAATEGRIKVRSMNLFTLLSVIFTSSHVFLFCISFHQTVNWLLCF